MTTKKVKNKSVVYSLRIDEDLLNEAKTKLDLPKFINESIKMALKDRCKTCGKVK